MTGGKEKGRRESSRTSNEEKRSKVEKEGKRKAQRYAVHCMSVGVRETCSNSFLQNQCASSVHRTYSRSYDTIAADAFAPNLSIFPLAQFKGSLFQCCAWRSFSFGRRRKRRRRRRRGRRWRKRKGRRHKSRRSRLYYTESSTQTTQPLWYTSSESLILCDLWFVITIFIIFTRTFRFIPAPIPIVIYFKGRRI